MPCVLGEGTAVRMLHVLRKPLSEGTVAANTLKHGTGGLNIDTSRITTTDNLDGGAYTQGRKSREMHPGGVDTWKDHWEDKERKYVPPTGRWPANIILQHLDGCKQDGVKRVKGSFLNHECTDGDLYGKYASVRKRGHTDKDGNETVANWVCEPGCPVARLDEQSGERKTTWIAPSRKNNRDGDFMGALNHPGHQGYNDAGGASRFYKQVGGSGETP
jgi:hypothetical protein